MGIWLLDYWSTLNGRICQCSGCSVWPDTGINAAAIKGFAFGMPDFILLLDKGEPDLGAQYIFIFIGNTIAVAESGTKSQNVPMTTTPEVNCVSAVH
jgi:hypothetical protein